jgi:hypothetical protein
MLPDRLATKRGLLRAAGEDDRRMTKQKTITFGLNKPIRISLPDKYWDILFAMAEMQSRTVEDLATERLKQIIIEDVTMGEYDGGLYGVLMSRG